MFISHYSSIFLFVFFSRVTQYVFVPTKDIYFNTLDQHADTLEGDVKPPLVLVGNEGSGKSALLANWVSRRREHKHRDEFLFQHFVGCTTQSLEVDYLLLKFRYSCLFPSLLVIPHFVSLGNCFERFLPTS
jgi:L-fucose isomerase-like protein